MLRNFRFFSALQICTNSLFGTLDELVHALCLCMAARQFDNFRDKPAIFIFFYNNGKFSCHRDEKKNAYIKLMHE